jgi:GNAT superfamily N-acetyltransferase
MTAGGFKYRTASEADAEALVSLINDAFEIELQFFDTERIDLGETLDHLKKGTFLLAESNGRLAGCNYVELRGNAGYFGLLSVDPAYQGRGLGKTLVDQAEELCRSAGCGVMQIRVLNHRSELPPFYEKLGYSVSGIEEVEQLPSPDCLSLSRTGKKLYNHSLKCTRSAKHEFKVIDDRVCMDQMLDFDAEHAAMAYPSRSAMHGKAVSRSNTQ